MSGILDSKTRVLDTFITQEGRKQLSFGGIEVSYVTFTDGATFYAADAISGSADSTVRLYLEASNLPQDQITFQADELGKLLPFQIGTSNKIGAGGQIVNYELDASSGGIVINTNVLTGSELSTISDTILSSQVDNFKKLNVIGSIDNLFDTNDFAVGNNNITLRLNGNDISKFTRDINSLPDILGDTKFRNLPNFKFLPPINKIEDENVNLSDFSATERYQMAEYSPWYDASSYEGYKPDYKREYDNCQKVGPECQKRIAIEPTSKENNLVLQAFEITPFAMSKLDVIDYGIWIPNSSNMTPKHFFFVGKLMKKNSTGTDAFIHLFTIIFELFKCFINLLVKKRF